jgi:ABC-type branched-subunit amino acid transport system ATPase component/ABC-type branched-subunit amino acid transport system permease subunit
METIIIYAVLGLGIGSVYAIGGQSLTVTYRSSGVLNFAYPGFALLGAYVFVETAGRGVPAGVSAIIGVAVAALAGVLTSSLVIGRLQQSSPLVRVVATLGVLAILQSTASIIYSDTLKSGPSVISHGTIKTGWSGFDLPTHTIVLVVIAIGLGLGLAAFYRKSIFGLVSTALAENEIAVASLGRSPGVTAAVSWALGGALAGICGVVLIPLTGVSVASYGYLILPALCAAMIGGFKSFTGATLGGLFVGVAQSEAVHYISAPGWSNAVPFFLILLLLVFRGRSLTLRGEILDRLPRVGTGRINPRVAIALALAGLIALLLTPSVWQVSIATGFGAALIALSVTVVTGYAGQLSLGQFALAGVGALAAAKISSALGVSFWLALPFGILVAAVVGGLVSMPALRVRGANLAVLTYGIAVVVEEVVLANPNYAGGAEGLHVRPPSIFGLSLDPTFYAKRYAILCYVALLACLLVIGALRRSGTGYNLIAVRNNERAASAVGISVVASKVVAFAVGAAFAAVGGILLAFQSSYVLFDGFTAGQSITIVILAAMCGIGFAAGGVLAGFSLTGAAIWFGLNKYIGVGDYLPLFFGVVVIVSLVTAPDGGVAKLAGDARKLYARFAGRGSGVTRSPSGAADPHPLLAGARHDPHPPTPAVLSYAGVTVRFGGVVALKNVSFEVAPGEVLGLIGPNGAGKTTLIDSANGFVTLSDGTIALDGVSMDGKSATARARAGVIRSFQGQELFEDLSVGENLVAASSASGGQRRVLRRSPRLSARMAEIVTSFELDELLARMPDKLSYGQRRLAGVARALAARPRVLLLDEPAAGLHPAERADLARLIRTVAKDWGVGVLLVEHNLDIVREVSDRVLVLDFGELIFGGTPDEMLASSEVVSAYLGAPQVAEASLDTLERVDVS